MLNTQLPALKSSLLSMIETILRVGNKFFMNRFHEKTIRPTIHNPLLGIPKVK